MIKWNEIITKTLIYLVRSDFSIALWYRFQQDLLIMTFNFTISIFQLSFSLPLQDKFK
jgi:hypothetical protein